MLVNLAIYLQTYGMMGLQKYLYTINREYFIVIAGLVRKLNTRKYIHNINDMWYRVVCLKIITQNILDMKYSRFVLYIPYPIATADAANPPTIPLRHLSDPYLFCIQS